MSIIGRLLTIGGGIAALVLVAQLMLGVGNPLASPRSPAGGSTLTVVADRAGVQHRIYLRTARSDSGIDPGWPVSCHVTGPDGEDVPLQDGGFDVRRTTNAGSFFPRQRWRATQSGVHQVSCVDPRFAVGPRVPVAAIGRAVLIGLLPASAGRLLSAAARRRRHGMAGHEAHRQRSDVPTVWR